MIYKLHLAPESPRNLVKMQVLIHQVSRLPGDAAGPGTDRIARTRAVSDPEQLQLQEVLSWGAASKVGIKV